MANHSICSVIATALLISVLALPTRVQAIGVCYGRLGDNLPQPSEVVDLYKSNNIGSMRIYDPNPDVLEALRGSNIQLLVGVPNDQLQSLASDSSAANAWVQSNVVAYWPSVSFRYIAVGNEVIPGDDAPYVLPAMQNVQNALASANLQGQIKVSTSVSTRVLGVSYPPSEGSFSSDTQADMNPIVQFLVNNGAPLLLNVYPYFSYKYNQAQISLSYALFTSPDVVVNDGPYGYQNLFDAIVDAAYASLEKVGGSSVEIVVSESGWPSAGDVETTIDNAGTYNQNLINHVGQGTPRRPGSAIEAYIFAMFNENQKDSELERNFGLFYPNKQPVYSIHFS
ncbi:glucan endo-1,3-beta-glucosidase-like [Musa acuminata AAA Group]|uniref:glucan endo-1,3-beta-glucosidase n=1 Tax=Musa acuminata AAA Group TaxID=214697 RepID=UPI0031D00156